MVSQKHNVTIDSLVSDLKPVSYFRRPTFLLALWLVFGLGYYALITTDLFGQPLSKITSLDRQSEINAWLLLGLFIYGSFLVFGLAVPNAKSRSLGAWLAVAGAIAWLGLIILNYPLPLITEGRALGPLASEDLFCAKFLTFISILPGIVLFAFVKFLAPVASRKTGAILFLTVALGAAFCLEYFCPNKTPVHRFYGHWSIVAVAAIAGWAWGRRLLRW